MASVYRRAARRWLSIIGGVLLVGEPLEFVCGENNRDIEQLPGVHSVVSNVEAAAAIGIPVR